MGYTGIPLPVDLAGIARESSAGVIELQAGRRIKSIQHVQGVIPDLTGQIDVAVTAVVKANAIILPRGTRGLGAGAKDTHAIVNWADAETVTSIRLSRSGGDRDLVVAFSLVEWY